MKAGFAAMNRTMGARLCFWQLQLARLAILLLTVACCTAAFAQSAFYSSNSIDLSSYSNGGLIRSEPLNGAPDNAVAYRVLYRSEGLQGEPIAVSGVVIIPAGPPPPNGRPIVAWAHPTTA